MTIHTDNCIAGDKIMNAKLSPAQLTGPGITAHNCDANASCETVRTPNASFVAEQPCKLCSLHATLSAATGDNDQQGPA